MRDCPDGEMRDQLPGYVHNTLSARDRAQVEEHLEACEDCAEEVELIRNAVHAYPEVRINIAKIVKALPSAPQPARRSFLAGNQWRLAAGLGAVLIGGLTVATLGGVFSRPASEPVRTASAPVSAPVATAPAPTTVAPAPPTVSTAPLASAPVPSAKPTGKSISFGGGLGDLTDEQLSTLLSELDGLEALPSTEPESHLGTIVPPANGGQGAR